MQQGTSSTNAVATILARAKPYVTNWTIQKTFQLCKHGGLAMLAGFAVSFIGMVAETAPLSTFGQTVTILGFLAILLGLAGGIIHSHIAIIRSKDREERSLAIRVLSISYGIVLGIMGLLAMAGNGPAFLKPVGAVVMIAIVLGIFFMAAVILGIVDFDEFLEAINFIPKQNKDLYEALPDVDAYLEQHGGRACYRCGSTNVHQFSLGRGTDTRKAYKCMSCDRYLYRTAIATY